MRKKALGDNVEYAGVGEVGVEGGVEDVPQCGCLRICRKLLEIGNGDANAVGSAGGLSLEPVLRVRAQGAKKQETDRCKP